jgi:predicted NBD/HSP70 family sugar kinase
MNPATYLGIDVGGTKILCQAFDEQLGVLREEKVSTDLDHGSEGVMKALEALIDRHFSADIKGIGVALPGIVHRRSGALMKAPNLPTTPGLEVKKLLEDRFHTTVHTENDINAFLSAEYERPELRQYDTVLGVMVGTGLGGAAIVDGRMLYGERGFACEFGHTVIDRDGTLKTLEENTGGAHHGRIPDDLKTHIVENLAIGLANFCLVFDPGAIVLGGSVYLHWAADRKERLTEVIRKHTLDGSAPVLLDASSDTSVAKGAVLQLIRRLTPA